MKIGFKYPKSIFNVNCIFASDLKLIDKLGFQKLPAFYSPFINFSQKKIKMIKSLRIFFVRQLIELNERFIFNKRLIRFYKSNFSKNLNVVIDVGANLGQTIDIVLKINPSCKVYAFEPNPELFKRLSSKYYKNKNIHLFQLGISDHEGIKTFYENILHSTSTLEDLNFSSIYLKKKSSVLGVSPEEIIKKTYSINVTTLSNFIMAYCATETIDILKIDTEGHEYYCLKGLFDKPHNNIKFVQLENHQDDMYANNKSFQDIRSILETNNFSMVEKIKHGFGAIDDLIFKNQTNTNNSRSL